MKTKTPGYRVGARKKKRLIFYICILALPLLQFAVFYLYVNFNSIVMAFTKYSEKPDGFGYIKEFAGFENFAVALKHIGERMYMLKNSLILFAVNLVLGISLMLVFSYFIYKKYIGHRIFRVMLFLPQIVSGVVFALIFKYLADTVYPSVMEDLGKQATGLISNNDTKVQFITVLCYTVFMGFGANVLLFTGSMSGINESIVESAQLDGVNSFQEFIHISVPMVYPTLVAFVILAVAGIFTDQMHLYTFYGGGAAELSTIGYDFYLQAKSATSNAGSLVGVDTAHLSYPVISAYGLIITAILFPLTMILRKLLTKFGPSAD